MTSRFSLDDYTAALQGLMPPGRAWPRDPDTVQAGILRILAKTFVRSDEACVKFLEDAFPPTTDQLLPEWEASLGLPDPCCGDNQPDQTRRAQVVLKLTRPAGASMAYFIGVAATLGFTVTIANDRPFRVGDTCGLPVKGDEWAHTWTVTAPAEVLNPLRADEACEQPLADLTATVVLECALRSRKPSHTALIFSYE